MLKGTKLTSDNNLAQLKKALSSIKELRARLEAVEQQQHEPIAIIGMGCRFPGGANSPEQYWDLLANSVDAIQETPADRWDVERFYDADAETMGKIASRFGGYIDEIDQFDPDFFGISPKEANLMDPQQRLFLQVAWEALESAGQTRESMAGSLTGVFVGMHSHSIDYYLMQTQALNEIEMYTGTGTSHSVTGGRLSYLFDLRGPNVTLDTACSSSLVATHLAIQSLRTHETNMAIAGGVNLMLTPEFSVAASRMHMLAPDGRCKTFDQRANGFVRGEGCGVIVMKRLADAQRDRDTVLAVIRGSAVNQDGKTNGLTAPNSLSQEAVIRAALANAGVDRSSISYVEAHGTGTSLGDPIEVEALAAVLSDVDRSDVYLGSAKTNIGHLEGAAGVAGIIKVVLSMQHKAITPLLHFTGLNPHISFEQTPFKVTTNLLPWEGEQRFAGISSFGWSGTNAHLIMEAAPEQANDVVVAQEKPVLLPLSAPSTQGLVAVAQAYQTYLNNGEGRDIPLNQIAYTASLRRSHFEHRLATVGKSHKELVTSLEQFISKVGQGNNLVGVSDEKATRKIAFIFPGQGGQWIGMGQRLLEREPVFRATLEKIDAAIQQYAKWSLLIELKTGEHFEAIDIIQPAIFAIQVGLAELWQSWGVKPEAIIGHSMGEVAGAYVAGILSLEDAVRIICRRSQLMKRLSNQGAMAVVGLSYDEAHGTLEQAGVSSKLGIGVSNSPRSTVLSGDPAALETVLAQLREQNIFCRPVNVDVAAHSPQMEALRPELVNELNGLRVQAANVPVYSTVSGQEQDGLAFDARYWGANLRQPVLFAKTVQQALADGFNTFIEIGPHPVLLTAVEQNMQHVGSTEGLTLASMRRKEDESAVMLEALGGLYTAGYAVDWAKLYPTPQSVVQLPTYPWVNQRFWIEESKGKPRKTSGGHPLIGQRLPTLAQLPDSSIWENVLDKGFERTIEAHFNQASDEKVFGGMALAAAEDLFGQSGHTISEILVTNPLPDSTSVSHVAQIVIDNSEEQITFRIFSRPSEPENAVWVELAQGQIQRDLTELDWLYDPQWMPSEPIVSQPLNKSEHWLIFADRNGLGQSLAEKISAAGVGTTLVHAGEQFKAENNRYVINAANKADYEQLFAAIPASQRILYLWGLDIPTVEQLDDNGLDTLQVLGVDSVVYAVQVLTGFEWSHSTDLWLATRDAVGGLRKVASSGVAQSPLWGLGRTIALEHPDLWGGLIDLPADANPERDATWLITELASPTAEDQIAYENDQRFVARLMHGDYQQAAEPFAWRSDSSYLITGGLGGLGLLMARWLVGQGVRHLALIGRRAPSAEAQQTIEELTEQGAQILTLSADVSKEDDVAQVLAEIKHHLPPLKGIIHSAAVIDNGIVMKLTSDQIGRVLSPKVTGTWNLHQLTQDLQLDCFITFSSFASLFGIAGESNYAAANAFVDSLMHHRRALGQPALAVNWGTWDEYGRAMEMQQFLGTLGLVLMPPAKALAGLTYLLRANATEAVVANINWEAFKAYFATSRQRRFLDEIQLNVTAAPQKVQQDFTDVLANTPEVDQRDLILNVIRTEAAGVLGFKPVEALDIKRGFFTLGMDSLMSVQLRNRLENQFGCFLPPTVAFEYPTIDALTNYVFDEVFKLAQAETVAQPTAAETPVKDMNDISQEDLMSLLDDELENLNKLMGDN